MVHAPRKLRHIAASFLLATECAERDAEAVAKKDRIMPLKVDEIQPLKLASLQAAATLLAGLAAHAAGHAFTLYLGPSDAAAPCVELAKKIFQEAAGEPWPT